MHSKMLSQLGNCKRKMNNWEKLSFDGVEDKGVIIKAVYLYIFAYLGVLAAIVGMLFFYPKPELHMLLNSHHTCQQDTFFKYFSYLAEGPLYVLALLPLLWKKTKMTVFFAVSELTGGTILQIIKHLISKDRPVTVFENHQDLVLPLVEGVDMHHGNSFPSGHASTFFVFCTCIAIIQAYYYCRKRPHTLTTQVVFNIAMLLLLAFAVIGAFTRVYLSQHFLLDICVGSIIGFTTPFIIFYLFKDKQLSFKKRVKK